MFRHHETGQNHNTEMAYRSSENVAKFRYFEATVTNQILIQEEIKSSCNSENACYHSIPNILPYCGPSKIVKSKKDKVIPVLN
jgi:hypothetical protein